MLCGEPWHQPCRRNCRRLRTDYADLSLHSWFLPAWVRLSMLSTRSQFASQRFSLACLGFSFLFRGVQRGYFSFQRECGEIMKADKLLISASYACAFGSASRSSNKTL